MSITTKKIYILPISGGEFPAQLGLLSQLYYAHLSLNNGLYSSDSYQPDICCGASGGNICSYIGLAADWNPDRIKAICKEIDPKMFIRNWWSGPLEFLPSMLLGITKQAIYRSGYGPLSLFETLFTPTTIQNSEILTLTFNETDKIPQIFSNRGLDNSFFKPDMFTYKTILGYNIDNISYADGDINKISEITVASYTIPLITQLKQIDGKNYGDGGISYASPFTPMRFVIGDNYTPSDTSKLQMTYFCSFNMNDPNLDTSSFYGTGSAFTNSLEQMLRTSILEDRWLGWQLLQMYGLKLDFEQGTDLDSKELGQILGRIQNKSYYLILYPKKAPHIDILNFNSKDILRVIDEASVDFCYFLWYESV